MSEHPEIEEKDLEEVPDPLAEMTDRWMRAVAETQNSQRRAQKDREDASRFAVTAFSRDMLTVMDNLSRALESETGSLESFIQGMEATRRDFIKTLERHGIKKVEAMGQVFDPNTHQAVSQVPDSPHESGTVVSVFQDGYMIHDRLLRPAMVSVAS